MTAAIVGPVLFFAVLEAGLRLGSYGYPTAFLVGPDVNGKCISNVRFGWRFFPRALARRPEPCSIAAKPASVVRIFVLGESAAQGIPDPAFSVGRILETMLRERYPDVKFEVLNAAMTAINSHVVREIAADCATHQADLFVVYMGNNEVIGPYGPGTVFQQWSPNLRFIRANIWLKSTRTGQLLGNSMGWFSSGKGSAKSWQGLEMFLENLVAADDPRLPAAYDGFRQNLIDICGIARRAKAGVVLSTVAVNLRDCPPFASQHRSDLSPEDLTKWNRLYEEGAKLEGKETWSEAVAKYEAAARIDDHFADLAFRMGRCFAALGRWKQARQQFGSARDLDALRFRTDSRINAIIREVAEQQKESGVALADAEQSLARSELADGGIPGASLFHEHVHFTFDGNYLLALALLDNVEVALPRLAASRKQAPVLSKERCAELLALTPWDEERLAKVMAQMTSRPPFTGQLDHAARSASEQGRVESLARLALTPHAMQSATEKYKAALEERPDDCYMRYNLARLELDRGQFAAAAQHLRIIREKWPWEATVYNDLGEASQGCGRIDEAIAYYRKAIDLDPKFAMAYNNLGVMLENRGRPADAIAEYRTALEIDPNLVMAHNNLAAALEKRGLLDESIAAYRKALEIEPNSATVRYNLATTLKNHGRIDEAAAEYAKALKIDPNFALAHNALGIILGQQRRLDEAIAHFQKAVELKPDNPEASANLANALQLRGQGSAGK
jgi:tetratricopeptide (TPR) repeat protein